MNVRGLDFGRRAAAVTSERELAHDIERRRGRARLSWIVTSMMVAVAVGAFVGESRRPPTPKPPPLEIQLQPLPGY